MFKSVVLSDICSRFNKRVHIFIKIIEKFTLVIRLGILQECEWLDVIVYRAGLLSHFFTEFCLDKKLFYILSNDFTKTK